MRIRRSAWLAIIVATAIAYLFSNGTVTMAIMVTAICIPVFSAVLFALSGRKLDVSISSKQEGAGDLLLVRTRCRNSSIIPVAMAEAVIAAKNLRTGERNEAKVSAYIGGKSEESVTAGLLTAHAGKYEICLDEIFVYDALRLFRKKVDASLKNYLLLRPKEFQMSLHFGSSSSSILESDKYSRIMQGNDPGEVRSIREYVPGDPVRNIHWKLSEKTGKMLVKELSLPVTDDLLMILDPVREDTGYAGMDACAAVYASLIKAALDEDMSFSVGWRNPVTGRAEIRKINSNIQAEEAAEEYLAVPARKEKDGFKNQQAGQGAGKGSNANSMRYAYIVTVGGMLPPDISDMASASAVTVLVCDPSGPANIEGIKVTGFGENDYEQSLASIEI